VRRPLTFGRGHASDWTLSCGPPRNIPITWITPPSFYFWPTQKHHAVLWILEKTMHFTIDSRRPITWITWGEPDGNSGSRRAAIYTAVTYRSETIGDKDNGGLQRNSRRSVTAEPNVQKYSTPKREQSWSDDRRHLLRASITWLQHHFEGPQDTNPSKQCVKI
jgi:hypothetical protein